MPAPIPNNLPSYASPSPSAPLLSTTSADDLPPPSYDFAMRNLHQPPEQNFQGQPTQVQITMPQNDQDEFRSSRRNSYDHIRNPPTSRQHVQITQITQPFNTANTTIIPPTSREGENSLDCLEECVIGCVRTKRRRLADEQNGTTQPPTSCETTMCMVSALFVVSLNFSNITIKIL